MNSAAEGAARGEGAAKLSCDENGMDDGFPYARPSVCELSGDIRIRPKQKTMYLVNPSGAGGFDENGEKQLRPYARKDDFLLPAMVEGKVLLLITNYKPWWVQKYTPVLRKLSSYDPINFDADAGVHCFLAGYLGLYRNRDLIISLHPTRNPRNYTMVDDDRFIRSAYALRRDRPSVLGEVPGMRPQVLIISRGGTRKLLNLEEVAAAAEELGFNVTVAEAGADMPAFAALVNAADVLLAVHASGRTNQIFLPTQVVVLQIVPWGNMDWMATNFYGQPAREMQLRY
uniref:Glycosyltransferase 61 catalytic domain-containing protein n=1 Tax=Hordeum vulgare subsp. vulgare TaxID=112509 RepID=A0A8I6X8V0_HORVV